MFKNIFAYKIKNINKINHTNPKKNHLLEILIYILFITIHKHCCIVFFIIKVIPNAIN